MMYLKYTRIRTTNFKKDIRIKMPILSKIRAYPIQNLSLSCTKLIYTKTERILYENRAYPIQNPSVFCTKLTI